MHIVAEINLSNKDDHILSKVNHANTSTKISKVQSQYHLTKANRDTNNIISK